MLGDDVDAGKITRDRLAPLGRTAWVQAMALEKLGDRHRHDLALAVSRPLCTSGQNLTEGSLGRGPHPWNISRIYAANRMRWTQPCMTFAWPLAKVTIETPSVTISSHSSVCSTPRISGWPVR